MAEFTDVIEYFVELSWDVGLLEGKDWARFKSTYREALARMDVVHDYGRYWGDIDPAGAKEVRDRLPTWRRALLCRTFPCPDAGEALPCSDAGKAGQLSPVADRGGQCCWPGWPALVQSLACWRAVSGVLR